MHTYLINLVELLCWVHLALGEMCVYSIKTECTMQTASLQVSTLTKSQHF